MKKVNTLSLKSNRKIKINFNGGDLSSDAGLLLIKEFVSKLAIDKQFLTARSRPTILHYLDTTRIKKTFFR